MAVILQNYSGRGIQHFFAKELTRSNVRVIVTSGECWQ